MLGQRWVQSVVAAAVLAGSLAAHGQRAHYQIGGVGGGARWAELANTALALDDTSFPGSLQPKELRPWENVIVGSGEKVNIFGQTWQFSKTGGEAFGFELGVNPRLWERRGSASSPEIIDGNPATSAAARHLVTLEEYRARSSTTSSAYEQGIMVYYDQAFTLDLAFEIPLNRVVFFPPQSGIDRFGVPNRLRSPQAYQLSVQRAPEDYLISASEGLPLSILENLIHRTLTNSESIVEVMFPLQAVRFLRIDVSLMPQFFSLAEIQAFGEGVVPRVTWLSEAVDFSQPVNFGAVAYGYGVWRRNADGELAEDPDQVARLRLETRTGTDDTPLAYLVVDDFGGDLEVSRADYDKAALPRRENTTIRYPGQKSGITEDRQNWSTWSSSYELSGLQNRSPDGRRYLQLRVSFQTDDLLSIGRLDSVVLEYSPLLAASVIGEVSPVDWAPGEAAEDGDRERPAEAPAGESRVFTYDLVASFDSPSQSGFDALRLDVPAGSEFLGLEMGDPLSPVTADSVTVGENEVLVYFPSHRVARNGHPLRLALRSTVVNSSTYFTGDVVDTQSDNLPQSIEPGNVRDDVPTNSLQVFASQRRLELLANVATEPKVVTPNGDGANDRMRIAFTLMFVETARVEVDILDLGGRPVRCLVAEERVRGGHEEWWDGTDEAGAAVAPGVYLCRVSAESQTETASMIRPVAVAY